MSALVTMFTDGSCLGNPGPGGWAVLLEYNGHRRELSGGFSNTTNNRMEIMAVIQGLEALTRPCTVEVHTDSRYLHDAVEKGWLAGWKRNGWKTAAKKSVKNQDLWLRLDKALTHHNVRFSWVRAHNGHTENERCDELARIQAALPGQPPDESYVPEILGERNT